MSAAVKVGGKLQSNVSRSGVTELQFLRPSPALKVCGGQPGSEASAPFGINSGAVTKIHSGLNVDGTSRFALFRAPVGDGRT